MKEDALQAIRSFSLSFLDELMVLVAMTKVTSRKWRIEAKAECLYEKRNQWIK
jgi:hypothetical protein